MASRMSCPWFVGRNEELRQLIDAHEATAAGAAAAVLVGGDAGIGKSRLVGELAKRASSTGALVLTGNCLDVTDGGVPYAPIHEVLDQLGESVESGGRPAEALPAALRRVAATRPVVLVLEDVHWADRSTQDLMTVLAGGPPIPGVLLVATYRLDGLVCGHPMRTVIAELERADRVQHVRLSSFRPADLAEQLRGILGAQPSDELVTTVMSRCDGNPFFAEELAAVGGGAELPPGLHELLLARIDRLDADAQRVVRAAAVGGRRIGHRLLATAVQLPPDVLDRGLRAAAQHHLLTVDRDGYRFRHALVHEAVLGELLPGERAMLHGDFAGAIDLDHGLVGAGWAAALVHHWSGAGRQQRAIAAALAAAVDAELAYALPEAQRYYDWLLSAWPGDDGRAGDLPVSRAEIVDRAADVASRAGDLDRAAELIATALEETSDDDGSTRAAILHERRGWCLLQQGRDEEALAAYEQAIGLVPERPPTAARARVLAAIADALERTDRPDEAARGAEQAVAAAVAAGSPADEGHARHTFGAALLAAGSLDAGLDELRRALDLAERGGDVADAVGVHLHLWRQLVAEGRPDEVVALAVDGAAQARRRAMPVLAGVLDAIAAGYCHQLGRWDEAQALLTNLDPGRLDGIVQLLVGAGLDADRGDLERAGDRLEIVRASTVGLRDGRIDGLLFRGLAERAWSRGHTDAVAAIVETGLQRTTVPEMIARLALVGLRAADGDSEEVERWVSTLDGLGAYADRRRLGAASELGAAALTGRAEHGRLAGGNDPGRWASAVAAWQRAGSPLPVAYCRWRHGEAVLAGRGDRDEAVALYQAAADGAATLGAAPLGTAIEQSARRGRLPSMAAAAPEVTAPLADFGITAREREVLELLARGWTNRQIAETLYISEKTARVHVSHLLTKLAVPTRGAAVDVAHRHGIISFAAADPSSADRRSV